MSTSNESKQQCGGTAQQNLGPPKDHTVDNSNPAEGVSICVPFMFRNLNHWRVKRAFEGLGWGFIERVDVVPIGNNKRAYIHFAPRRWNTRNPAAMEALAAMKRGDEVKVEYDTPWFWKIGISRAMKPGEAPKPRPKTRVTIVAKTAPVKAKAVVVKHKVVVAKVETRQEVKAEVKAELAKVCGGTTEDGEVTGDGKQ